MYRGAQIAVAFFQGGKLRREGMLGAVDEEAAGTDRALLPQNIAAQPCAFFQYKQGIQPPK